MFYATYSVLMLSNTLMTIIMVVSSTMDGAISDLRTTINLLRFLGFHILWAKVTHPATTETYLGVEIDTLAMELRMPAEKVEKFKAMVNRFTSAVFISKKDLERLNGLLSHCAQVVQGGCIFTRRCYNMYKSMVNSHRKRMCYQQVCMRTCTFGDCSTLPSMVFA